METSILTSTKKVLGVGQDYTAFDLDILTHINSAFSTLNQLGLGPEGFTVEDSAKNWNELGLPPEQLNMVRSYIFLKVRIAFDPPGTSYLIEAVNKQIQEQEHRLSAYREVEVMEAVKALEEAESA